MSQHRSDDASLTSNTATPSTQKQSFEKSISHSDDSTQSSYGTELAEDSNHIMDSSLFESKNSKQGNDDYQADFHEVTESHSSNQGSNLSTTSTLNLVKNTDGDDYESDFEPSEVVKSISHASSKAYESDFTAEDQTYSLEFSTEESPSQSHDSYSADFATESSRSKSIQGGDNTHISVERKSSSESRSVSTVSSSKSIIVYNHVHAEEYNSEFESYTEDISTHSKSEGDNSITLSYSTSYQTRSTSPQTYSDDSFHSDTSAAVQEFSKCMMEKLRANGRNGGTEHQETLAFQLKKGKQ